MIGIIEYFQRPDENFRRNIIPGNICLSPIQFTLYDKPIRLKINAYDANKPSNTTFCLEKTDLNRFDPREESSLRYWGLESDDYLLAVGCKTRPSIILSEPITEHAHNIIGFSGYLVAPIYSIYNASGDYKKHITRELVIRVQAYQAKNLFYLPSSDEFGLGESFVRLDRIQFVRLDHMSPRPVCLTERALDILRQWSWNYLGISAILDPALDEYIKIAATKIRK
jgi:hypothetical protein